MENIKNQIADRLELLSKKTEALEKENKELLEKNASLTEKNDQYNKLEKSRNIVEKLAEKGLVSDDAKENLVVKFASPEYDIDNIEKIAEDLDEKVSDVGELVEKVGTSLTNDEQFIEDINS